MKLDRDKRQIKNVCPSAFRKDIAYFRRECFQRRDYRKGRFFRSSKRNGNGIGTQSVRRIAEKDGGYCRFSHENGIFTADVMLHGKN